MTYTAARHPNAARLWIVVVAATCQRAARQQHFTTKRDALALAEHLNAIDAPIATMTGTA